MALGEWQYVRQIPWPYPGMPADAATALAGAIGTENSFLLWPEIVQAEARSSLEAGVKLGCVAADYAAQPLFGTATVRRGALELRLIWKPAA